MTEGVRSILRRAARVGVAPLLGFLSVLIPVWPGSANAQLKAASAASSPGARPPVSQKASPGPAWSELEPSEQVALRPLQNDWASIDDLGKRKWRRIAERYAEMTAPDQERLQARMTEWARLTPQQRGKARLQYLEAKKVPARSRQADWEAYQALSPEARAALAERGVTVPRPAAKSTEATARNVSSRHNTPRGAVAANAGASAPAARPAKPATPTVVQAAPGATTVLITKRHISSPQPTAGSARIAIAPEEIDKSTLLPRTGSQSPPAKPTKATAPGARP